MSKLKGNVVDPEVMVEKYGADTCRLFVLFAAPPEKDMPWIEASVGGQRRFLERVWKFVTRNVDGPLDFSSRLNRIKLFNQKIEVLRGSPFFDLVSSAATG